MDGRSYVFLHGFTGEPAAWDEVRLELGRPRALAPSLAGHDGGEATAASFDGEVDRLAALIEAAGFAGAHLCGYSLGGRVALGLLVRHGRLFSAATVIGANPGLRTEEERQARRADDQRWIDMLLQQGVPAFVAAWERQPLWATQASMPPEVVAAQRAIRLRHSAEGLASSLRVLGLSAMPDYGSRLGSIEVPVTLAAGERDSKFVGAARTMAPLVKKASVVIVPGAGHNVLLERPRELAAILRDGGPSP